MNRSSLLYRELTSEELEAVFASALPGERVLEYGLLSGGLFNTTYRVKTEAHDTVLRMGPVNRELLLPFEHGLMGAEACVDGLCHGAGIPASRVLCCDTSKSVLDRDFMVVEYIESIPLSSDRVPKDAVPELHRECGMLAKKLHGITGEMFGRVSQVLSGNGKATWASLYSFLLRSQECAASFCCPDLTILHAAERPDSFQMLFACHHWQQVTSRMRNSYLYFHFCNLRFFIIFNVK